MFPYHMQLHSAGLKTTDFIVKNKVISGQRAKRALENFGVPGFFIKWEHQISLELLDQDLREGIILSLQDRSSGEFWFNKTPKSQRKVFFLHRRQSLERNKKM